MINKNNKKLGVKKITDDCYEVTGKIGNNINTISVMRHAPFLASGTTHKKEYWNKIDKFYEVHKTEYKETGRQLLNYLEDIGLWDLIENKYIKLIPITPHCSAANKFTKMGIKRQNIINKNNNKLFEGDKLYKRCMCARKPLTGGYGKFENGKFVEVAREDRKKVKAYEAGQYSYSASEIKELILNGGITLFGLNIMDSQPFAYVDNDNEEYKSLINVFDEYAIWKEHKINVETSNKTGTTQYGTHGHAIIKLNSEIQQLVGKHNFSEIITENGAPSDFEIFYKQGRIGFIGVGFYLVDKHGTHKPELYNYQITQEIQLTRPTINTLSELKEIILKNPVLTRDIAKATPIHKKKEVKTPSFKKEGFSYKINNSIGESTLEYYSSIIAPIYEKESKNHNNFIREFIGGCKEEARLKEEVTEELVYKICTKASEQDMHSRLAQVNTIYSDPSPNLYYGMLFNDLTHEKNADKLRYCINLLMQEANQENPIFGSMKDFLYYLFNTYIQDDPIFRDQIKYIIAAFIDPNVKISTSKKRNEDLYGSSFTSSHFHQALIRILNSKKYIQNNSYTSYNILVEEVINENKNKLYKKASFMLGFIKTTNKELEKNTSNKIPIIHEDGFIYEFLTRKIWPLISREQLFKAVSQSGIKKHLIQLNTYFEDHYNLKRDKNNFYIKYENKQIHIDASSYNAYYEDLIKVLKIVVRRYGADNARLRARNIDYKNFLEYTEEEINENNDIRLFKNGYYDVETCKFYEKECNELTKYKIGYKKRNKEINLLTYNKKYTLGWLLDPKNREAIGLALRTLINTVFPSSDLEDARDISKYNSNKKQYSTENKYFKMFKQILQLLYFQFLKEDRLRKTYYLYGPSATGKTTLGAINQLLFNDNATIIAARRLKDKFAHGYKDANSIMIDDPNPSELFELNSMLRSEAGEISQKARELGEQTIIEYTPPPYVITTNKLPRQIAQNDADIRRAVLLRFPNQFLPPAECPDAADNKRFMATNLKRTIKSDPEGLNQLISLIINFGELTKGNEQYIQSKIDKINIILGVNEDPLLNFLEKCYMYDDSITEINKTERGLSMAEIKETYATWHKYELYKDFDTNKRENSFEIGKKIGMMTNGIEITNGKATRDKTGRNSTEYPLKRRNIANKIKRATDIKPGTLLNESKELLGQERQTLEEASKLLTIIDKNATQDTEGRAEIIEIDLIKIARDKYNITPYEGIIILEQRGIIVKYPHVVFKPEK